MSSKKPAQDDQHRRFQEAARELGCDDSEERFREVMRQVAKAKPLPKDEKAKLATKDKAKD